MNPTRIAMIGGCLCLGGAAFGALGLLGTITGARALTTIVPGQPPMTPNTAVALLAIGVGGALRRPEEVGCVRRTLSLLAAVLVLAIGVGTLVEYAVPVDLHIDRLFDPTSRGGPYPGRPSPSTALALALLALALMDFDARPTARVRPPEWLALSAGLIAFTALLGQLFGAGPLYRLTRAPVTGVAVPTALGLLLTACGLLLERPHAGVMRVAASGGPGGTLLRRFSPVAVLAPAVFGLIDARLLPIVGIQNAPMIFATLAAAMTVAGLFLLTVTAVPLDHTHEALVSSRAQARALIEQASEGIFVADLDGRYTDVNGAACRMLGFSREELVGTTIADLIHPEDAERLSQAKEHLLDGGVHAAEWTLRRKNGTYLPVDVSSKILKDGRWQGFMRDMSERKRAEAALRVAEATSSGILSISADAIMSIDDDQRITMFNEGAERIFGHSKTEVMGAPLDVLIPERFRATHRGHVERFAAGEEVARRMGSRGAAIYGLRKDGSEFPADAAISRLDIAGIGSRNLYATPKRILTVALRDVTDQKRTESEQRFLAEVGPVLASTLEYEDTLTSVAQLAVRHLADLCIVDVAAEDGESRHVKVVSREPKMAWVCDLLARSPLDWRRSRLASPDPAVLQGPSEMASLAQDEEQLGALRTLDPHSAVAVPLTARGKVLGVVALLSTTPSRVYGPADVRMAERLAQRAALSIDNARLYRRAQRAIQARDDVLGIVAHDLRNPLGAILMQATLLRRGAEPEGRSRKPAELIERAATRMNRLIEDLLELTRMEAGGLSLERTHLPAGQVVVDSVEAQRPLASQAALELRLDAEDLPEVWADRDRLLQVFENLIGNAIKFAEPHGRIVVGAAPRDGGVLFWVSNTGAGIASGELPHVFDRFWQARKGGRRGVGLGLPIVRGIVESHEGRVWVESAPGQGSTFFFTIPTGPGAKRLAS